MKKNILLAIAIILFFYAIAAAQYKKVAQSKTAYRVYTNTCYHFSFEIPVGWKITGNGDGMDYTCNPVTKAEKAYYAGYGEVFEFQVKPMGLDSATGGAFRHGSDGAYYYNPPMSAEIKVDRVNGKDFTGLHEIHSCRVSLDKREPEQTTVVDGCEQLYLSNGKITIVLTTAGVALEEADYKRLIQTLRFL
jgi:hypothetical protein